MTSYVAKGYNRDRRPDGQLRQIELYSSPEDGRVSEESKRLNKEHHEYMLATHDLKEQGVEFFPLYEKEIPEAHRLGISLVQAGPESREWEKWHHLPPQERQEVADRLSAEYHRSLGSAPAVDGAAWADSAPLGLAAFALTTFLLSAFNADWMTKASGLAFLGYAFAYGGLCQLLAGMWEFRNRNVFGATAFSTYGGFWIGLGLYFQLVGAKLLVHPLTVPLFNHDVGWILLAFAIFNTYMLIMSTQVNMAVFAVFLTLELTEIILSIGNFAGNTNIVKVGGYIGVLTAIVAWYASAAGVANGMAGRFSLPVGRPLIAPRASYGRVWGSKIGS